MNKDKIKKILDKTDIYVLDEINILEYIDELEKVKEDYIKSLDKLDVLENRIDSVCNLLEPTILLNGTMTAKGLQKILDTLRGEE